MGQENFTYTVWDGQLHDSAKFTVTVGDAKVASDSPQPMIYTDEDGRETTILIPTGAIGKEVVFLYNDLIDLALVDSTPLDNLMFGQRVFEINAYLNGILQR